MVQPGSTLVDFSANLSPGCSRWRMRNVRLLVTGDFDNDGRDEFAFVNYLPGGGSAQAAVQVYDNDVTTGWVRRTYDPGYGVMFEDMGVGDFNADGRDDIVLVRNGDQLVLVKNVSPWSTMAQASNFGFDWYAVAGGNISNTPSTPGDEITALRDSANAQKNNLVTFRVVSGVLSVWPDPQPVWNYNPAFVSISDGNLNDGPTNPAPDDEIVMLRDPGSATGTSLLVLNPFGDTMPGFSQATGNGANLFKIVRTGDTDGDGLAEIVILRGNLYRIYTEPNVDARNTETAGAFYVSGGVSNLPFLAVANVDGPGIAEGPVLSVTPASLSFSLDCGAASPIKPLSITNAGTGSSFAWQAQAIETNGSGWLLIDAPSGTTPGTVNVSVRPGIAKGNYTGTVRVTTTDSAVQNKTVECSGHLCGAVFRLLGQPGYAQLQCAVGQHRNAVGGDRWAGANRLEFYCVTGAPNQLLQLADPERYDRHNACHRERLCERCDSRGGFQTVLDHCSQQIRSGVPGSPQYVTVNLTVADPGFVVTPTDITIRQLTMRLPIPPPSSAT